MQNGFKINEFRRYARKMTSRCYLKCIRDINPRINLPHNEPVYIGRNHCTAIIDTRVSRKQVMVTADIPKCKVSVKTIGSAYSGCNGYALKKYSTYGLIHGDILELRLGHHQYEIVFDPPPKESSEETPAKKPKLDSFNIMMKASAQDNSQGLWESIDDNKLLIFTPHDVKHSELISAFDMDGTLIKTKSGSRFPKDQFDWELNYPNVVQKLKEYSEKGYKIVMFTNQAGVSAKKVKIGELKNKIQHILKKIGLPIQVFIATGDNIYRKPLPGMWQTLCKEKNGGTIVNLEKSFFVGDAAGRPKNWAPKRTKDHSTADRFFAANIGINFFTPEEFFLGASPVSYNEAKFNPKTITVPNFSFHPPDKQEIIIMVGGPGSGKSYFVNKYLLPHGYAHVNRDTLGSWQKCVKSLTEFVERKQSVVIDNTNPDKDSRKRYVQVAKDKNIACRCFVMTTSQSQSRHNNKFRELTDKKHLQVGEIVINSFYKHYQPPELGEGFEEIVNVPFIPDFYSKEREELYGMFLLPD